jgi:hypothetical protein
LRASLVFNLVSSTLLLSHPLQLSAFSIQRALL